MTRVDHKYGRWPGILLLFFGVLAGPLALLWNEALGYILVPLACRGGWRGVLHLVPVVFIVIVTIALFVALRALREGGGDPDSDDPHVWGRTEWLGSVGVISSGFFLLMLLGMWLPTWFLHPCINVSH